MQKTAWKTTKYSRNETIFKIGHLAKAIDFAKWWVWLKNSTGQKRAKNDSTSTLQLLCEKNRWKKHQIFEKWDHFENRPSCKGYRLCKMVSLAQKLKWPKTCEKRFCKLKIGHLAKAIDFAKWWVWLKNSTGQKRAKNDSTSTLQLLCEKNRWKKHQIFEKWDHFENRPSCKGYRLCKMVSFGSKTQMAKNVAKNDSASALELFCAKKPLEKTPYIREMRPFWKSAILQRL